jgi:hypothetical protein
MSDKTITMEGLGDLHRSVRDALDLAIAGGAPLSVLEKLGAASGLVQALIELPRHALIPEVVGRAHRALTVWQEWERQGLRRVAA